MLRIFIIMFSVFAINLANAATCPIGEYLTDDGTCAVCSLKSEPVYCPGDDIRYNCPENNRDISEFVEQGGIVTGQYESYAWAEDGRIKSLYACQAVFYVSTARGNYSRYCHWNGQNYFFPCDWIPYRWELAAPGYYFTDIQYTAAFSERYYYSDIAQCTNAAENAKYTGAGTPDNNDCPWECNDGLGRSAENTCLPLCTSGVTKLHVGNDVSIPLFQTKNTSPAIYIEYKNQICYADLTVGTKSGTLNVQKDGITYHTTKE